MPGGAARTGQAAPTTLTPALSLREREYSVHRRSPGKAQPPPGMMTPKPEHRITNAQAR
ncbi:hypothetical protein [Superficieibacter electus]|uniref:hypothetical protein n=1 Tax=Superficieibacter electus TaxID=2022662 RepID=UPI00159EEE39|nr:hypothetical protein [Superficieibacter electus]